ncbi:MAG: 1,2-phenylacetyl-CoA epoxidase subunit PaaD [Bacteroidota bacterium]
MITEAKVYTALEDVKDPEIPVISVVDLGVIHNVEIADNERVTVEMTPTFAGCPAIDAMKSDIYRAMQEQLDLPKERVTVNVLYNQVWTTNKITERGRVILKGFGLSPPPEFDGMLTLEVLQNAVCPNCNSNNTFMMSTFGPTACRAIHHCNNCKETFEQFKPL